MYKHYILDKSIKSIMVCGDLHGNFNLLRYKIRESQINNSVIIIAGDCGFGFEKKEYYKLQYGKMKKVLFKQNVQVMFVRGNHDDKSYFDGEKINFEKFIAIPDYSVITFDNEDNPRNILCVGGATSIDRKWRIREQSKYTSGKKLYWEDEFPVYNSETLNKIKDDGLEISALITHTSPSFAPLTDKNGIQSFIAFDPSLSEDVNYERLTLTKIYDHLIKKDNHPLKINVYGHFHQHNLFYSDEDVKFIMLDCVGEHNNSWDIYQIRFE